MYGQPHVKLFQETPQPVALRTQKRYVPPLRQELYCPDRISLFDSPSAFVDGEQIQFKRRKSYALLAYLAVNRRSYSREYLATLLWPDAPEKKSAQNLRNLLVDIHSIPSSDILWLERQMIGINTFIQVDAHEFEARFQPLLNHNPLSGTLSHETITQLEEAVQLYGSGFLAGFYLKDSAEFDDWQYLNTQNYLNAVLTILTTLANYYLLHHMVEQAYQAIHHWLAIDPLAEEAHQLLMQLYIQRNQPDQALHQYQTLVRLIRKQDGSEPLPETRMIYDAIRHGKFNSISP